MANKVSMTLPPESAQWGRSVESRLSSIERINSNLVTSVNTANATLGALLKANRGVNQQVQFLLTQSVYAEKWNIPDEEGQGKVTTSPADTDIPNTWLPFHEDYDASVDVTTSSTGNLMVQLSGLIGSSSLGAARAQTFLGLEILQGSTVINSPDGGDGPRIETRSGAATSDIMNVDLALVGVPLLTQNYMYLSPNTTYTLRARRGYSVVAGLASNRTAYSRWTGTAISVTKLGM